MVLVLFPQYVIADSKDKDNPTADRYNVTDASGILAFGKSYYELDGRPSGANGNFYSTSNANWSIKQWPDKNTKKHIATYLHFPKCSSNAKIQLTTTGSVTLKVVVTNMENGTEVATQEVVIPRGAKQWVDILPATNFPNEGWYKFDFQCLKGVSYVGEFFYWQFEKTGSSDRICTADYMSSPSVHLSGWKTTDPNAPASRMYDWAYQEVMVPESSAVVGTYCMSLGILHGYMGIQIDSDNDYPIIFSMWDNGSTDEDPNLPAYLRSGALDWETGVTIARFANEGTGAQAKYRTGRNWVPGRWVKFITNARPEIVNVEIDDPNKPGQKKTITYTNTLCSAWYQADGLDEDWHYIATIRQSGANNYFDGWYSFLENYNWPTGQWERKAYYRNGGLHSLSDGHWYHANSVGFGHTDGGSKYGDRRDYGQGETEDFENSFFMSTGGYKDQPVQNAQTVPLIRNFMPVDQATLDRLTARVNQAIRTEQVRAMKENVSNACETYAQSLFKVIAKSDEATNEGESNRATAVFDDNENTYWHSQWSGGEKAYPHTLTVQASEEVHIGQITLCQKRASSYRAKQITVSESEDNRTWTKLETLQLEDAERPTVELTTPITKPYFKLSFDKGYGGNLLCINEIYLKSSPSLEVLKEQAAAILAMENQFGGYSSEALATLKAVYDGGAVTEFKELSAALNDLAANAQPLKYGRVDAIKNVSSFKAYQIHSLDAKGDLIATADGNAVCTGNGAAINVVDPLSNWLIVYSNRTEKYYAYNLGAKKFLRAGGGSYSLTSEITPVTLSYTMGGFRLGTSDTWELRDNYVAQPAFEVPQGVLAAIEYELDAAARAQKAAHAASFLEQARKDILLDFDDKYAGIYDVTALEQVLANPAASVDEIAAAYDQVRASAMPSTAKYYRLANFLRPTSGSLNNYLTISGTEKNWKFITHRSATLNPTSTSSVSENLRTFQLEKADNDTTFYVYFPATRSYLLTPNVVGGNSGSAEPVRLSYEGKRLFRLGNTKNYLTVNSSRELTPTTAREDAELFYFEEVKVLPEAVSVDESGYGAVCLPLSVVLPEGVEAYVAPMLTPEGVLLLDPLDNYLDEAHHGLLPAYTPVVLRSKNGEAVAATDCEIYDDRLSAEAARVAQHNILRGAPYKQTVKRTDYVFATPASSLKASPSTTLASCKPYLPTAVLPEGFSGPITMGSLTGIGRVREPLNSQLSAFSPQSYDLQGRLKADNQGVTIQQGRKEMRK